MLLLALVLAGLLAAALAVLAVLRQARLKPSKFVDRTAADIRADDDSAIKNGFASRKVPSNLDAIVIGSGIGGLSTAALLARQGKRVLVLEQHDVAGGCTHVFNEKGFEFDTGLHYVGAHVGNPNGPPSMSRELMRLVTDDMVEWAKMDDCFDVAVFGDTLKNTFETSASPAQYKANLAKLFPSETEAIEKYFELIREAVKFGRNYFMLSTLPGIVAKFVHARMAQQEQDFVHTTAYTVLRRLTSNEKLINTLTYCFGDYGLPPKRAPFFLHALVVHHYFGGAYYPVGGTAVIAKAMTAVIKKAGGEVLVRAPVTEICIEGGKATGVVVIKAGESHTIRAPLVISSAGARNTYEKLIAKQNSPLIKEQLDLLQKFSKELAPSSQHISLYVGFKGTAEELNLPNRNYWVLTDPDRPHDVVFDEYLGQPGDGADPLKKTVPLIFASFPSAKDPTWAARLGPNKNVGLLLTEARWEWFEKWADGRVKHRGAEYEAVKKHFEDEMLRVLMKMFPHLEGKVEYTEVGSPLSSAYYLGAAKGESYGLTHTPFRMANSRVFGPTTPVPGLYLTGQDVTSAGIFGALAGGLMSATCISRRVIWDNLSLFVASKGK
mmetsp:Transcript_39518/g.99620  ORF Transcript_39518/g.99620 Transcript_39518/m.99620 type:complete len:607 (+) Transcript_39518:61-1881(+)